MASARAVRNRTRDGHGLRPGPQGDVRGGHLLARGCIVDPARPSVEDVIDEIVAGVRRACTYAGAAHPRGVPRAGDRRPPEHRRLRRGPPAADQLVVGQVTGTPALPMRRSSRSFRPCATVVPPPGPCPARYERSRRDCVQRGGGVRQQITDRHACHPQTAVVRCDRDRLSEELALSGVEQEMR